MEKRKYELTKNFKMHNGKKLFQIRALIDVGSRAKAGELGGYVEEEKNLDQFGNAWVYGDARVYGNAQVSGDAWVSGGAQVFGNAQVSGDAFVFGGAQVSGDALVFGGALVSGGALVFGNAQVSGDARVFGNAQVSGDAFVSGGAQVFGNAQVSGDARVFGDEDILQITGLGTRNRTTTAFRTKNGVYVKCGCFYGDVEQFRDQVKRTREGKVQAEYLKFAELMEIYFEEVKMNE